MMENLNHVDDEKISFSYNSLQFLIDDENDILSILQENMYSMENIFLIPFRINFDGSKPFNTFMLYNDNINNNLCFPFLEKLNISFINNFEFLKTIIKCYLFSLNLKCDYESFEKNCIFKGLYVYNNNIYLFIDLTKIDEKSDLIEKNNLYWFALVDEIMNKKHVCNIKIDENVINFFSNNSDFLYLKNDNNEQIEIPTVVYSGAHDKMLYFTYLFGKTKGDSYNIFGSSFYFTDFKNAIREGGWSSNYSDEYKYGEKITENENGKYIKGGIIRYAIFLGNCHIVENLPNDKIDESEIKKMKLNDKLNFDYNYEKMTLRVSDHDGLWKNNYDSVFLGDLELDDGQKISYNPIYAIKDYENQISLSYHYINKKFLNNKFIKNNEYHIL